MGNKQKWLLAIAAVMGFSLVGTAQAVEVAGDMLNVYGKAHVSLLAADADDGTGRNLSLSSNSSRIGFKGQHDAGNGLTVVWKVESGIELDAGEGKWASRNSYAGLKGDFGQLIIGQHDTPFKTTLTRWAAFRDTIGDARAIFGSTAMGDTAAPFLSIGNKLDTRGKNSLMYSKKMGALSLAVMYAADADASKGKVDNNDNDLTSISLTYSDGPLWLTFGQVSWSDLGAGEEIDGLRIAAKYDVSAELKMGLLYESTRSDTTPYLDRDIMGINARFQQGAYSFRAQVVQADDYEGSTNTGATVTTLGAFHQYDKHTEVYVVYTAVNNDAGAAFQGIDGGHGDELKTVAGGDPSALALGMIYKF